MECKRHKWRVGSKNGEIINRKIVAISENIWCEKCNKKIKANLFSDYELEQMRKTKGA